MLNRVVRTLSQAALTAAVVAAVGLLSPFDAQAHTETVETRPRMGEVVYGSPTEVTIRFGEDLAEGSSIQVLDDGFRRMDRGKTMIDAQDPRIMRVALGTLPEGGYTAQWTAVDAADGHSSKGSFAFNVRPAAWWPRLLDWIDRHLHILVTGWVLKAGLTVFIGRWVIRRRKARKAAAEALEAVETLWEDESS